MLLNRPVTVVLGFFSLMFSYISSVCQVVKLGLEGSQKPNRHAEFSRSLTVDEIYVTQTCGRGKYNSGLSSWLFIKFKFLSSFCFCFLPKLALT